MYAVICASPGGPPKNVTPDTLNKYRGGRRGMSLKDWFGAGRQGLAEKQARAAEANEAAEAPKPETNGAINGGGGG
jgi:hypothetical protein